MNLGLLVAVSSKDCRCIFYSPAILRNTTTTANNDSYSEYLQWCQKNNYPQYPDNGGIGYSEWCEKHNPRHNGNECECYNYQF
jgi:hypothetical protein